jgi:radical SAM protein with 4Fe4S-binding SPASM domain
MCGRRKLEKEDPYYAAKQGDMDYRLVMEIGRQIPPGTVVQLHWNGEPTLYPALKDVARLFRKTGCYVCMTTNGLLIGDLAKDLVDFHSIAVSIIQGDSGENYKRQITQDKPKIVMRFLGKTPWSRFSRFMAYLNVTAAHRALHLPERSAAYQQASIQKFEHGVCQDLLSHPAIDRHGNVFPCVRINPENLNYLGNIEKAPLEKILKNRTRIIDQHFKGNRNQVPLCKDCDFYGVPLNPCNKCVTERG